jgi:hypothetical protein
VLFHGRAAGICAAPVPFGFAINASRAQDAPTKRGETLEQNVACLEREVSELQKRVRELERRSPALRIQPVPPGIGGVQPSLPPNAKPFSFNNRTYYWVPLNGEEKPAILTSQPQGEMPVVVSQSAPPQATP